MRCAIIAGASFALIACTNAHAQQGRGDTGFAWSKQLRAGSTITIRNGDGPIQMREVAGDRVEVRATKILRSRGSLRDVAFDVRESADGVTICTVYGRQTSCRGDGVTGSARVRVEYTVLIPAGVNADLMAGTGDVDVRFASSPTVGEWSFRSVSGNVIVGLPREFIGRIDVRTGSGTLRSDFDMSVFGRLGAHALRATIGQGLGGPLLHLQTGKGHVDLRKN